MDRFRFISPYTTARLDKRQKIFSHTDIVLHSANTSEIQATKKPHNYHKIAVWQKDDRIRKSPLKFCVYYYSELEGDCQASIITELCRLSVVFCVALWHMRNSVWFCTRGEWACSPIVGEAARCCLGCFQNDFLSWLFWLISFLWLFALISCLAIECQIVKFHSFLNAVPTAMHRST